jgi:hypothetical protein
MLTPGPSAGKSGGDAKTFTCPVAANFYTMPIFSKTPPVFEKRGFRVRLNDLSK